MTTIRKLILLFVSKIQNTPAPISQERTLENGTIRVLEDNQIRITES